MKADSDSTAPDLAAALAAAGWVVPDALLRDLSPYDRDFLRIEMTGRRTADYYARRLARLGFTGEGRVLDAACGVGQWSLALARNFSHVTGVDLNAPRIAAARVLAAAHGRTNCEFHVSALEEMAVATASCEAVFCYGAFMFTDMPRTLAEFRRVLRPGGRVYLNANSTGWCAHLLLDRGVFAGNGTQARAALRMIRRTLQGRTSQIVVRREWLVRTMETAGFAVRALGVEGTLVIAPEAPAVEPAYPPRFYGLPSILELVAEVRS